MFNATHSLGYHVPAAKALQPGRFRLEQVSSPPACDRLPEKANFLDDCLAPAFVTEVQSVPMPIAELPKPSEEADLMDSVSKFKDLVYYTPVEISKIEEVTRGQSDNIEWYRQCFKP